MSFLDRVTFELFSADWWKASSARALRTAISVFLPFLALNTIIFELNWVVIGSTIALAVIGSFLTSLVGLKELTNESVPKFQAILVRAIKQFAQTLVSLIGVSVLITDVDWKHALLLSLTSAITTILSGTLTTLPEEEEQPIG